MKNMIKKIILVSVCIISCLGLTGCGETLSQYISVHVPEAISARGARNKDIAYEFYEIGAISTAMYEKCISDIDQQVKRYTDASADPSDLASSLAPAIKRMHLAGNGNPYAITYIDDDKNTYVLGWDSDDKVWIYEDKKDTIKIENKNNNDNLGQVVMSNYIYLNVLSANLRTTCGLDDYSTVDEDISDEDVANGVGGSISPIVFINKELMDSLNEMAQMELYVLKPEILEQKGINGLDGVMTMIQKVVDEDSSSFKSGSDIVEKDKEVSAAKVKYLENYFIPAKDKNGNTIKLIDENDEDFKIARISKDNFKNEHGYRLGYDGCLSQDSLEDCLQVRFQEFNEDGLEKLKSYIGDKKYYIVRDPEGSWKAYLMEYPISVMDTMKLSVRTDAWAKDSGDYAKVEVNLKKSGLGINLMSGSFVKYKCTSGAGEELKFDYNDAEQIDITGDYYLTTGGSQNNSADPLSSLVVKGYTTVEIENSAGKKIETLCGRIILRDYLEATFAPNYPESSDEGNLVVFGRKIRFDLSNSNFFKVKQKLGSSKFEVDNDVLLFERGTTVASFVDVNGEQVPDSPTLEITDFCDTAKIQENDPIISRLAIKGEEAFENIKEVTVDTPDTSDLSITNMDKSINAVTMFPSNDIGKVDYRADTKQKQRFYCILTTKGMFNSGLYSTWVESTVEDASLDWWMEYLHANGFSYQVNHKAVTQYLSDNFKYQLSQNGVVILDLETVEKIQEMYDDEANAKRVDAIRTAFIIIGWTLIFGSFLLLLFWVIDTNTDIGLGLLEKVTMGNWVAVRYEEDIPNQNANNQKYMTFKRIMIKTMIIIAMGILLIKVDIFYILTVIVDLFGVLADKIERIIQGRM